MAYRNQYNTRNSRYNTTGQFVSAGEMGQQPKIQPTPTHQTFNIDPDVETAQQQGAPPNSQSDNLHVIQTEDMKMETELNQEQKPLPHWMKNKLSGGVVKKLSMKERRRRQNENLRRLLTPKNALMVLNEMLPKRDVGNQFKVEPAPPSSYYGGKTTNFCADLFVDGTVYKGFGDNKIVARNSAAEQAIRDLIIKRIEKACYSNDHNGDSDMAEDDSPLPMIQLASFALHKLFSEWEFEGHKVPALRPPVTQPAGDAEMAASGAGEGPAGAGPAADAAGAGPGGVRARSKGKKPRKPKEIPANAASMHPCMLLTYLRPALVYRDLPPEGDKPQTVVYTMAVDVDGNTFTGRAGNKKEARRNAAQAACSALFNVTFEPQAAASVPVLH